MDLLFNIVICDDNVDFLEVLYKKIADIISERRLRCDIVKVYNAKELVEYCKSNVVDIIFTDIDMPDENDMKISDITNTEGFTAAQMLQEQYPNIEIVFVSAHEELAYHAFRYRPFSFVSKRDLKRLNEDLAELLGKIKKKKSSNVLFPLTTGDKTHMIDVHEIIYFKIEKHYIRAYNVNGKSFSYRCGIKDAYEQLSGMDFIYIHRSYLLNCRYIKYFDTQNIVMFNDEKISVTRDKNKLKAAQGIFARYKRRSR